MMVAEDDAMRKNGVEEALLDVETDKKFLFGLPASLPTMVKSELGVEEPMPTLPLLATIKLVLVEDPTTN